MSVLTAVARLRFELEDDDFFAFAVFLHRGQHPGTFDDRFARGDIIAIGNKQHAIQLERAADIHV